MRPSHPPLRHSRPAGEPKRLKLRPALMVGALLVFLSLALVPGGAFASRQPGSLGTSTDSRAGPTVTGADFTLYAPQLSGDLNDTKEKSLGSNLTIPAGQRQVTFTSSATRAPIDFTDIGPRWWVDTPDGTSLLVELRTSKDGNNWTEWLQADVEDILSPEDSPTTTFASLVSVAQADRTHRYVQSRVTLATGSPGLSPTFHELSYTFINAGVTTNPPKPKAMVMGNPSDAPKPVMVPRAGWGAPEGESSPKWLPRYRRVTHIVIHHTATPNEDGDYAARVRAIWYFHSHTRGWGDIGYNYVIDPNGVIYEGRAGGDDTEAGHAYPFNAGTMGVGILGNFERVAPAAAAQAALVDLISWKVNQRGIDPLGTEVIKGYTNCGTVITYTRPTISGHRDFRGTACGRAFNTSTCPGDRLYSMLAQIRAAVITEQPALRAVFTSHDTPGNLAPNTQADVHISVRNSGSLTWQKSGQGAVTLGYRWLTAEGKPAAGGALDARFAIPREVSFAGAITMTVKLKVPVQPGHYAVVWDMHRDGQGWFADGGSSNPLRVDVVVGKGVGDTIPPSSEVLPLPVYSNNPQVAVRWAGQDDPKGSGIASYDIQYRIIPQGTWTDWKNATSDTSAIFEGQDGYTFGFRSRARDAAGNVEDWRDEPDAYTTVDTTPPPLHVDTPNNGAHVQPGKLLVRGRTEPGAFVAVNDQRAQQADGVFTSTVEASGRDFAIHVTAADAAGNVAQMEVVVQAAPRYNDVSMENPAFLAIEYLSDQGVVSGYSDGSFKPDAPMTRAQVAKTLATALHWGLIKPGEARFSDVSPETWMYPYVETAAARKVMEGYSDGTFRPNSAMSRASAVKSLVIAAGWKPVYPRASHFLDVTIRSAFSPYIESAYIHGAVYPDSEGNFYPTAPATRADITQMVYGMLTSMMAENPPNLGDDQGP